MWETHKSWEPAKLCKTVFFFLPPWGHDVANVSLVLVIVHTEVDYSYSPFIYIVRFRPGVVESQCHDPSSL